MFYQMDHIWEAPSKLKKTLALIFLMILAIILRQDFLKTLYVISYLFIKTMNLGSNITYTLSLVLHGSDDHKKSIEGLVRFESNFYINMAFWIDELLLK